MDIRRFSIVTLVILLLLSASDNSYSQFEPTQMKKKKPQMKSEPRNVWGIGLEYSEGGFGPVVSYYLPASYNSDFLFRLSFSGYSDSKEIQRTDVNGNVYIDNKINRIFTMPLSIGWRVEPFKKDLEGSFNPVFNIGLAPALVFFNPYDQEFFSAIDDTKVKFAFGGFTGIGFTYRQSEDVSMNMNFGYYYLPIVGDPVYSIVQNPITNVGGFQIAFGVNFLK